MHSARSSRRGTATLEYLVLLSAMTIAMAGALFALGPGIVEVFQVRMIWLSLPIP